MDVDDINQACVLRGVDGTYYRIMPPSYAVSACFHRKTFPSAAAYNTFLTQQFMRDPCWRESLRREASRWTCARYGASAICRNPAESLSHWFNDGYLGLFIVMLGRPHSGEKKKVEVKKELLETASTVADLLPVVAPIKSALQAVTGLDLITDAPVDRMGERLGAVAGLSLGGKALLKLIRKRLNTPPKRSAPKPIGMPQKKVPCFKAEGLPQSKVPEFERQLAGQEKGLNNLSADEYLKGRGLYSTARNPKVARDARADFQAKITKDSTDDLIAQGVPRAEAKAKAAEMAAEKMGALAALHNPDLVVGGKDVIGDFGDRNVNSSIGSQWKSRVGELDEAVKKIPEADRGKVKVNAKLERCK